MIKNILVIAGFIAGFSSCSKPKSEAVPLANVESQSVGPYAVDFNNDAKTYQHSFHVNISQDEGKVEYNVLTAESVEIELIAAALQVTGCSASQVIHQIFWIPDAQKTSGAAIRLGSSFKTIAGIQGTLMHKIRGLNGCSSVDLLTTLHQKAKAVLPARKCKESTDTTCKVEMYCTEPGYRYTEVEVWKESWGATLRKYGVNSDGTRSLSSLDTVQGVVSPDKVTYQATSNRNNLVVIPTTGASVYTIYAAGQSFPMNLTCQSYL